MKVVGLDEAGCGCLMGSLVASAVLLNENNNTIYNDSKKLSDSQRRRLFTEIYNNHKIGVGIVTAFEIDNLGMAKCRRLVFHRALDALVASHPDVIPDFLIVDGTIFGDWIRKQEIRRSSP